VGDLIITAPGRCQGVVVKWRGKSEKDHTITVEFLSSVGPYKKGDTALYASSDVRWALNPGDLVAYDPAYLRRNAADQREYKRRAHVVNRREGALVALEWEDGQGPQTDSTLHLVRL
jgi:hypothetical protein